MKMAAFSRLGGGAAVAAAVGLSAAAWWIHQHGYEAGRTDSESAHTRAELQQFKADTRHLSALSNRLAGQIDSLASAAPEIIKEYHETVVKTPLPAGCVINADRMRGINAAIAEAAAAR